MVPVPVGLKGQMPSCSVRTAFAPLTAVCGAALHYYLSVDSPLVAPSLYRGTVNLYVAVLYRYVDGQLHAAFQVLVPFDNLLERQCLLPVPDRY